jgi:preprotein translocase subunit SecD
MRKTFLVSMVTALMLGIAACAGAPAATAANDQAACTAPHGFVLSGDPAPPLATDADVVEVRVVRDPEKAQSALSIRFNDAAAARVRSYTAAHVGERVTITIGDRVILRLTVRDPIQDRVLVTGSGEADADRLRARLCVS